MLLNLYQKNELSLRDMEKILGYSKWGIRTRLVSHGIPIRSRGGSNRRERKLGGIGDELWEKSAGILSRKYNVAISTVFLERRMRGGRPKDDSTGRDNEEDKGEGEEDFGV